MLLRDNLSTIAVLFTLIVGIIGATTYFAKASDLVAFKKVVEYKFLGDQILDVEKRIWVIEDRYRINMPGAQPIPMPVTVQETYRRLQKTLKELMMRQEALLKES